VLLIVFSFMNSMYSSVAVAVAVAKVQ
jgi:hypothetical protein